MTLHVPNKIILLQDKRLNTQECQLNRRRTLNNHHCRLPGTKNESLQIEI